MHHRFVIAFAVTLCCVLNYSDGSAGLHFVKKPKELYDFIPRTASFRLQCKAVSSNHQHVSYKWLFNGSPLKYDKHRKWHGQKHDLVLSNLQLKHNGKYTCIAYTTGESGKSEASVSTRIKIYERIYFAQWEEWSECSPKPGSNTGVRSRYRNCITSLGTRAPESKCSIYGYSNEAESCKLNFFPKHSVTQASSKPGSTGTPTPASSKPGSTGTPTPASSKPGSTGTPTPASSKPGSTSTPTPASSKPGSTGTPTPASSKPGSTGTPTPASSKSGSTGTPVPVITDSEIKAAALQVVRKISASDSEGRWKAFLGTFYGRLAIGSSLAILVVILCCVIFVLVGHKIEKKEKKKKKRRRRFMEDVEEIDGFDDEPPRENRDKYEDEMDRKAFEKRRVIKELTPKDRKRSELDDDLIVARAIILEEGINKEHDREVAEKRKKVVEKTSSLACKNSLLESINCTRAIIMDKDTPEADDGEETPIPSSPKIPSTEYKARISSGGSSRGSSYHSLEGARNTETVQEQGSFSMLVMQPVEPVSFQAKQATIKRTQDWELKDN